MQCQQEPPWELYLLFLSEMAGPIGQGEACGLRAWAFPSRPSTGRRQWKGTSIEPRAGCPQGCQSWSPAPGMKQIWAQKPLDWEAEQVAATPQLLPGLQRWSAWTTGAGLPSVSTGAGSGHNALGRSAATWLRGSDAGPGPMVAAAPPSPRPG